jgi:uncharacterized protein YciI
MHVVFLRFGEHKARAGELTESHVEWLTRGFADDVFVLSGTIAPGLGGAILAHNITQAELAERVAEDPFVMHGVVTSEIIEISASRADERLSFLVSA